MSKSITQLHNISPEEFKNEILDGVETRLKAFHNSIIHKQESVWLTRNEVKELLSVSLVTIHHWSVKGILKPYKIGRQVRFKRSDITELLEESNAPKIKPNK